MKLTPLAATFLPLCLLASCATMQTHKNVRLQGIHFKGQVLEQPQKVYLSQGQWYIAVHETKLQKHYPVIEDTVFLDHRPPYYTQLDGDKSICYLPISEGTAKILRDPQGYASLPVLQKEIETALEAHAQIPTAGNRLPLIRFSLPQVQSFPVRAELEPTSDICIICDDKMSHQPSFGNRFFAGLDLAFVDAPGTLLYNVAIPIMAPIYFFKNMINDINKDPLGQ